MERKEVGLTEKEEEELDEANLGSMWKDGDNLKLSIIMRWLKSLILRAFINCKRKIETVGKAKSLAPPMFLFSFPCVG